MTLIETYRVVDATEATDPEAASVSDRVARALPRTADDALTVSALAEALDATERTARHGLDQLASRVRRLGTGRRGDPYRFFIPAYPDLKGMEEWNKPESDQKGGQPMAIRADERGPPLAGLGGVQTNAGAGNPGTANSND